MRERITYFLRDSSDFEKETLNVQNNALSVSSLNGAKEHRITLSLKEVPKEIETLLTDCHELHIRWTRPNSYDPITPLVSRSSPGLHAFFTPRKGRSQSRFCPTFRKVFGDNIECETPEKTFAAVPALSERFSSGSAYQYHQLLPSLEDLVDYLHHKVCQQTNKECVEQLEAIRSATYIDIDFDTISHALIINTFWNQPPRSNGWSETIQQRSASEKIEVGVLNEENPLEPEELKIGGFLTVIGEDEKPSPTLFSFPSRHHPLSKSSTTTFTTSFRPPTGLHPTLQISFPADSLEPPSTTCSLHTYLTLPSFLFIDKYQLSDPLFLSSQNLIALHSIAGETDLEAPDWVIQKWGSAALVELASPNCQLGEECRHEEFIASIPLHLRYLPPTNDSSGVTSMAVPWPVVFWACTAEEGTKMSVNPFDRVNLGYDSLFGPRTMFYHVPPAFKAIGQTDLVEHINVPVLRLDQAKYIEAGTVFAVVLGSLWVLWKLFRVLGGHGRDVAGHVKTQ